MGRKCFNYLIISFLSTYDFLKIHENLRVEIIFVFFVLYR